MSIKLPTPIIPQARLRARDGYVYPLYYNTLFADLRNEFNKALRSAKHAGRGYWPKDATRSGVVVSGKSSLTAIKPICPKLWRRLEEYLPQPRSLAGFIPWLAQKNHRIDILSVMEERGHQDLVKVSGKKVRLKEASENL